MGRPLRNVPERRVRCDGFGAALIIIRSTHRKIQVQCGRRSTGTLAQDAQRNAGTVQLISPGLAEVQNFTGLSASTAQTRTRPTSNSIPGS
jgi:hypothetical protein